MATRIGKGVVVEGDLSAEEDVLVEGTVHGRLLEGAVVTVAAGGLVEAAVEARRVAVAGEVRGDVAADERVEIRSEGRLTGDIRSRRIQIAEGATFRGRVDMDG